MIKFDLFGRRFVLYFRKVIVVKGLNSECKDGTHIGMVDIDNDDIQYLREELKRVMFTYGVPRADIMSTGKPGGYHVYLWKGFTFRESLRVMLEFPTCDLAHVRWTIKRGHATLRLTDKKGRRIKILETLHRGGNDERQLYDLKSWVKYQTGVWDNAS